MGDTAVCSHQNWCENALVVLWEDSVAAEGVLGVRWQWRQWVGDTTPVSAAKKETDPKNTSVHCPCCCWFIQQFAGWLWCHLCGPSCPNPGMQTCMVPPVLGLQPQWDVGWTPRCQVSCIVNLLPGVKAWCLFLAVFPLLGEGMKLGCACSGKDWGEKFLCDFSLKR